MIYEVRTKRSNIFGFPKTIIGSDAFKTKEGADRFIASLPSDAEVIEIVKHPRAEKYIVNDCGHRIRAK